MPTVVFIYILRYINHILDKFMDVIGGHAYICMCILHRHVLYVFVHISDGVHACVCIVKPVRGVVDSRRETELGTRI